MKLINLNVECGIVYEPLMEFIKKYSVDTDIFCFQEVFHNADTTKIRSFLVNKARPKLFSEFQNILLDFNGYHFPTREGEFGGLAIFIKKSFVVNKVENIVISRESSKTIDESDENYFAMGRNLQRMKFSHLGKKYSIFNFHGKWIVNGKGDTKKRIEQSEKLRKIFDESNGAKILCGDLNVERDTESMAILNKDNRNLIQEYNIDSTRSLSKKRPEVVDYVIVSPEVDVEDFKVLSDEVSDHLAMSLVFN